MKVNCDARKIFKIQLYKFEFEEAKKHVNERKWENQTSVEE